MNRWKIIGFCIVSFLFAACNDSSSSTISFPGTDKIVVTYAPKFNFSAPDVKKVQITEKAVVDSWLKALEKIPTKGSGIRAKMAGDSPAYKIAFYKATTKLGILRAIGERLDAPFEDGFDFYERDIDRDFITLLKSSVK
ncbi:hypothetical protein [Candidatus Uabimicrobium sp. HlEnr_7]|uniref:hypothetical protein n=1 Tax=Candidatus Uabimicrobium helgolandensis TaxID=3095367 RepID=UPI003557E6F3